MVASDLTIKYQKLHPKAKSPTRATPGAAGYDIYSLEEVRIRPGQTKLLRTGLAMEIPKDYFTMIAPRSSLCLKQHLDMPQSVGICDEDFVGEYMVVYRNIGQETVVIKEGEKFAQLVFIKYSSAQFTEVNKLKTTKRGSGKFGSSGKF